MPTNRITHDVSAVQPGVVEWRGVISGVGGVDLDLIDGKGLAVTHAGANAPYVFTVQGHGNLLTLECAAQVITLSGNPDVEKPCTFVLDPVARTVSVQVLAAPGGADDDLAATEILVFKFAERNSQAQ